MCKHCIAGGSNEVWDQETMFSQLVKWLPRILKIAVYSLVLYISEARSRGKATKEINYLYNSKSFSLYWYSFCLSLYQKSFLNFFSSMRKLLPME